MKYIIVSSLLLVLFAASSNAQDTFDHDPWYFNAEGIETAYRYQEMFGARLHNPLRGRDCLLGQKKFAAAYRGKEFSASCRFITETIRHLKEMLTVGAAKYLFPLDADHGHLAIPADLWESKYRKMPREKLLSALLEEPALAVLYHTAEHLTVFDGETEKENREAKAWKLKRNVLGFYDGRPIEILPPDPRGFGVSAPEPYYTIGGFSFLASPGGELSLFLKGKAVVFDVSFDIGDGELTSDSVAQIPAN